MSTLSTAADLRTVYQQPSGGAVGKDIAHIDVHFSRFIGLSPFLCIGTSGEDGLCDVSPRGGEPGFVHVIDEHTLAMPDRPGNNRLDSMSNLTARPGVGLLFFIPGFEDCLRVNGLARMSTDEALMGRFLHDGRPPRSVMLIDVKEAYFHCPKAIRRAGLWDPDAQVDRSTFPSPGQILRDQMKLDMPARSIDDAIDQNARDELY
ncbi:MAG: pyridoxamine 5'-phosphate oxidase family protein [Hyphomonas sp.]|uniref:pyridoxamine 5'-phosphate oxidase family protein n=1 Tax=Hyphomonas sp. TaxID=87 RepID=UPI003528584D